MLRLVAMDQQRPALLIGQNLVDHDGAFLQASLVPTITIAILYDVICVAEDVVMRKDVCLIVSDVPLGAEDVNKVDEQRQPAADEEIRLALGALLQ